MKIYALLAEFETTDALLEAAEAVRDAGFARWDAHTPFVVHGLDEAMGIRSSILPYIVAIGGFTGCLVGIGLQWWTNAVDYPFLISGKPLFSLPANIPIAFEMTILFAAITALVGMLALNGLPRHHHPLFSSENFRRVTDDRFFISIDASDPLFDREKTRELLEGLNPSSLEEVEA